MTSEAQSIVDLVKAAPPRGLKAFETQFVEELGSPDEPAHAVLGVVCSNCAGTLFRVSELTSNTSPVGISLRCVRCERDATLFNATTDGYDGVCGHLNFLKENISSQPLRDESGSVLESVEVHCAFTYNAPLSELIETAEDENASPQDLFDGFQILAKSSGGAWAEVWGFECA